MRGVGRLATVGTKRLRGRSGGLGGAHFCGACLLIACVAGIQTVAITRLVLVRANMVCKHGFTCTQLCFCLHHFPPYMHDARGVCLRSGRSFGFAFSCGHSSDIRIVSTPRMPSQCDTEPGQKRQEQPKGTENAQSAVANCAGVRVIRRAPLCLRIFGDTPSTKCLVGA